MRQLTDKELEQLLRIQRYRRAGFLPSILDCDFLLELVGRLLPEMLGVAK